MRWRITVGAAMALGLALGGVAQATTDTTPPTISALSLAPAAVDTSTAPAIVDVSATVTDDVGMRSGDVVVTLQSPTGRQTTSGMLFIVSGFQWTGKVKIAAHSETGTWTVARVYMKDVAGNYRYVYPADLAALGLGGLSVTVTGVPDTTPPTLTAVSASPATVDAGNAPAVATVTATVTDDLAGVNDSTDPCSISCMASTQIALMSPSRTQFAVGEFTSVGGDVYVEKMIFPAHAEPGVWTVNNVDLVDTAGNERIANTLPSGLSLTVIVINSGAPAPTISHTISPISPDGANGWYVSPPTIAFSCNDVTYTVVACDSPVTLGESASAQTVTGTVLTSAGSYGTDSVSVRVDLSNPTVVCRHAAFVADQPGAAVSAAVTDPVSGPQATDASMPVSTAAGGAFAVDVTGFDRAGRSTTTSCPYTVLGAPEIAPLDRFQLQTSFPLSWASPDGAAIGATYDVRYMRASDAGGFGPWTTWLSGTSETTATFPGTPGASYCFTARAHDQDGNLTRWSLVKCTAVPVDGATLTPSGAWTAGTGSDYYLGTVSTSSTLADTLTLPNVTAQHVALLVTKCPECGTVQLLWNGAVLQTINLRSGSRSTQQFLTTINLGALQTGTLTVRVASSARPIEIDGIGITQR